MCRCAEGRAAAVAAVGALISGDLAASRRLAGVAVAVVAEESRALKDRILAAKARLQR